MTVETRVATPPSPTVAPTMTRLVAVVFLPFAGGYFLSYLFRSTNAVIAPQLTDQIGLTAADLGLLTSCYFLAFASFQLPLGLLLDRFGPRRVQSALLLSAALGAGLFAAGDSLVELAVARAFIGLGVSGGLMASFKAITLWFPKDRWPLVNGCFLAMGGLGAIAATAPLEAALEVTDWRGVFAGLAAVTVLVAAVIRFAVPERPATGGHGTFRQQVAGYRTVFGDRLFWRVAPLTVTTMTANLAIQGLWAGPWLRDVAGFDRAGVATYLFAIAAAMTAGFVATGAFADWCGRRGIGLIPVVGGLCAAFLLAQAAIAFELAPASLLPWLAFGLLANGAALAYPLLNRHFPLALAGRASTGLNTLAFFGAFAGQYLLGAAIDLWPPAEAGGYRPEAYRWAFGGLLALQAAGLLWYLLPGGTREPETAR
ncbi:membrane protein [Thalassobaculum fulvum]|uniref:Membrane protein n=1 Tax=Thalassobaculum fulvum TaxID=1633335 RepID=A0A918XTF5_9PROT|nr:MFS transporter [Thalassobaculum fulvum]GHD54730.1 membrane protein [Thalassobaculum fulvum]